VGAALRVKTGVVPLEMVSVPQTESASTPHPESCRQAPGAAEDRLPSDVAFSLKAGNGVHSECSPNIRQGRGRQEVLPIVRCAAYTKG